MNWRWTKALALGAVGFAMSGAIGCAQERDPINRVQSDALQKSFFVGKDLVSQGDNPDFYANGTLLDIGYGATQDGLFNGFYSNDLTIIRWEITENYLIGRLAFERIDGSDGKGAGRETNDGQVIYVFKIKSHFDVRQAYNPSTGEEINVVEENTTDRVWYEREFFRVDWSQNLNTDGYDFDTLAVYGVLFGIDWEPISYFINDQNHPHAPNFDLKDGYFDITTKAYATPGMIDISHYGWGYSNIPACWLDGDFAGGSAPAGNCNPVEVTMRHSFWKKPDTDYEPQDWDGYMFQATGPFVKERYGFARNYGMSDNYWRRFVQRYNIWERSHYYADPENMEGPVECYTPSTTPPGEDPHRDLDNNGTHDECESVGLGSRCDSFKQKCTLPYIQRTPRPVAMYYTVDSDQRYYEPTNMAAQDWDAAMRVAVLAAKNAECFRVNGVDCDINFPAPHGQMTMMQDLVETIREVDACLVAAGTWDPAACASVAAQELAERGYTEGTEDHLAMYTAATMQKMVTLCHSPIEAGDHPACAPGKARLPAHITAEMCDVERNKDGGDPAIRAACDRAHNVRIGDIRYHLVNVVKSPQTGSPWGFGPTYADPLTGEGISASVNMWSWPTDMISQGTIDNARFIAGELSVDQVTDGVYVKDWAEAARLAGNGHGALPPMTREMHDHRKFSATRAVFRDLETGEPAMAAGDEVFNPEALSPKVLESIKKVRELRHVKADINEQSVFAPTYRARMKQVQDTETEAELISKPMLQWAGVEKLPLELATQFASPMRGFFNPTLNRQTRHIRELALAERGACMLEAEHFAPSPTAMLSLTRVLQEKFGDFNAADPTAVQLERAAKMQKWLASKMHYAVTIHEMGHTFGLRHNFVSSSSAINFRPQYWQLRTRNGQITDECVDLTNTEDEAANCVGPRYFDQITQEESDEAIWTWMHSSVMDYAGDYTQDMLGLGAYDFAATRMFYGETATVFADADLNEGTDLGAAIVDTVMDNFGGILGYQYQDALPVLSGVALDSHRIHYSQLNRAYNLISNCRDVDPNTFKPSNWDDEKHGLWSPLFDGLIVRVNGNYSRCNQRRVAFVPWDRLRFPTVSGFYRGGPAIDPLGRTRVPYGFGTDRWADLGNLSVYRHDAGADPYELFNFFISEQEVRHIFDNYRRDRQTFSVRGASNRILTRYNTKLRDGAKGMGLVANNIRNIGLEIGLESSSYFAAMVNLWGWGDNLLASGQGFDHFARQLQRPNAGPHTDPAAPNTNVSVVLRWDDTDSAAVIVPDGAQGFWNSVGIGGKLVNNALSDEHGEYDVQYTINAGSYYDKLHSTMLMTESVDNFVSDSLDDFVDARGRAISMADLFPDGFRRYLANNLTGDDYIKAPRIAAIGLNPDTMPDGFPRTPIGWISWWGDTPELCFPAAGTQVCSGYDQDGTPFEPLAPASTRAIDPQVGWEQFKHLIATTLVYLPENQKEIWLDMMGIWEIGSDTDPGFPNRIELHLPTGEVYVARTYGTEEICFETCRTVQRGIGARVLQYANELLAQAYEHTVVPNDGVTGAEWYLPVIVDGKARVKYDPNLGYLDPDFTGGSPPPGCNATDNSECECNQNGACLALQNYQSVPTFMRQAMRDFKMADPTMKGIYE